MKEGLQAGEHAVQCVLRAAYLQAAGGQRELHAAPSEHCAAPKLGALRWPSESPKDRATTTSAVLCGVYRRLSEKVASNVGSGSWPMGVLVLPSVQLAAIRLALLRGQE